MLPNGAFTQQRHRKTPSDALSALLMHRGSYKSPEGPPIPAKDQSTSKSTQAPLGEIHHNLERPGPSSKPTGRQLMDRTRLLHKKSTSDIRINRQELDKNKGDVKTKSPKKTKSSRNLAGFWGKAKPTQDKDSQQEVKYKENEAPNSAVEPIISLPISAQFSSRQIAFGTKVVLNDTQTAEQQVRKNNSQSCPPTKTESLDNKHALARYEGIKVPLKDSVESKPIVSGRTFGLLRRSNSSKSIDSDNTKIATRGRDSRPVSRPATSEGVSDKVMGTTRGKSRVRAAVAAISGRNKDPAPVAKSTKANPVDVEKEFEDMLEARNIAPEVRGKMRALDHSIKADLLKQDLIKSNNTNTSQVEEVSSGSRASSRPGVRSRTNTTESVQQVKIVNTDNVEKKTRPRSFTGFTLSKGGSSPKKQKQSKVPNHSRGKSVDIPRSISTTSLVSIASPSNFNLFGKTPKYAVPDDFISYLRANLRPQIVEVGRIQKLRQLLRNETVAWVDEFITEGGMIELVNLIYRIIDIEWREEHEDNLLHHALTCLKALTTTSIAMQQLEGLQAKLFPALLALLFSSGENKKGPSEFTTRSLILSLLFASIAAAPTPDRARSILSYLRDPAPKEATVNFISNMHRPRPYKLWGTEIGNVGREVFWIFLHHINVIDYPNPEIGNLPYNVAHFPTSRPPVPAAPYVGSVEWDATIYLATHLDLLNGIIASVGTPNERNQLRAELKDSGFEKIMGGTLRTCKEKFYGHIHASLSTWAGAARADGWDSKDVREGPRKENNGRSKSSSPRKKDHAPILAMPKLDFQSPLSPMAAEKGRTEFAAWL